MALIPTMRDVLIDITSPLSLLDQKLGIALLNDALLHPRGTIAGPIQSSYIRPWRHIPGHKSGTSSIQLDKDGFMVNLDVQHFRPGEVLVKTDGSHVTVEGTHEERPDEHGLISRRFKRRYALPDAVEGGAVTSTLSADGVLTIRAPKRHAIADEKARVIPIVHTRTPAIKQSALRASTNGGAQSIGS